MTPLTDCKWPYGFKALTGEHAASAAALSIPCSLMHMPFRSSLTPIPPQSDPLPDTQCAAHRYNPERLSDLSHHVNLQVLCWP